MESSAGDGLVQKISGDAGSRGRLSPRELAVLAVLRSGVTTKEIAARLRISRGTVNYHLTNIYRKLRAHSRVQVINALAELTPAVQVETEMNAVALATRLAAELDLPGAHKHRAAYYKLNGDAIAPLAEFDLTNAHVNTEFRVVEHPFFYEIAASEQPRSGALDSRLLGPQVRKIVAATGVTHGAGVPVHRGGALHGILAIGSRGEEVSREHLSRLIDLGRLVELALVPISPSEAAN